MRTLSRELSSNQRSRNSYCIRVYTMPGIVATLLTTATNACVCLVQGVYSAWNLPRIKLNVYLRNLYQTLELKFRLHCFTYLKVVQVLYTKRSFKDFISKLALGSRIGGAPPSWFKYLWSLPANYGAHNDFDDMGGERSSAEGFLYGINILLLQELLPTK